MADVRRFQRGDDLSELIVLSRAFFEEYQVHHDDFFQIGKLNDHEITDYFLQFVDQDDRAAFIATRNDHVVGYITVYVESRPSYWRVRRVGHISGLMVQKEHRREGIGTRLLERAREFFREHGLGYHTVYTAASNLEALSFYEKRGMQPLYSHLLGVTSRGHE